MGYRERPMKERGGRMAGAAVPRVQKFLAKTGDILNPIGMESPYQKKGHPARLIAQDYGHRTRAFACP